MNSVDALEIGMAGCRRRLDAVLAGDARVIDHVLHGDVQGGFLFMHDHTQRIPHQYDVHARLIQQPSETGVVGGKAGDFFTHAFQIAQAGER